MILSCLLDPEYTSVILASGITPEFFYDYKNRVIFNIIAELYKRHKVVTPQAVHEVGVSESEYSGDYRGDLQYLMEVVNYCPSPVGYRLHLNQLLHYFHARKAAELSHNIRTSLGKTVSVEEIKSEVADTMALFRKELVEEIDGSLEKPFDDYMAQLEDYKRGKGATIGMPTRYSYLDKLTSGLHKGENLILAARPGCGKTAFALNLAESLSIQQGIPGLIVSLEMKVDKLLARMLCSMARVNAQKFRTGYAEESDFTKLALMRPHIVKAPLYIVHKPSMTDVEFENLVTYFQEKKGVEYFILDYLTLLKPAKQGRSKEDEVGQINTTVTRVVREGNIAGLTLAQMNRDKEKEPNRLPRSSDLRGSGEIEQDADTIMFIHPFPEKQDKSADEDEEQQDWSDVRKKVQMVVTKQRNGPQGVANMMFFKSCLRMEECFEQTQPEDMNLSYSPYLPDDYGEFEKKPVNFDDIPPL